MFSLCKLQSSTQEHAIVSVDLLLVRITYNNGFAVNYQYSMHCNHLCPEDDCKNSLHYAHLKSVRLKAKLSLLKKG